mmetsp:Transcript_11638/g.20981  ORF Transcript_11638/g.20981 Transcript_11638/m.20981 type:complete len:206 (-) Transcript_11638:554-1171(-)
MKNTYHMPRTSTPIAMATAAPINVLKKLTTSFVIHPNPSFSCNVAPIKLSHIVAKNAANVATPNPSNDDINPTPRYAYAESDNPPTTDANVPSSEIAPSVPLGTLFKLVIKNVVLPYAFPISLAKVSANLVANDATYPSTHTSFEMPRASTPDLTEIAAAMAHKEPVKALPQTFSGPLRPPLPSAMPSDSFSSNPILVTSCPRKR